MHGLQSLSLIGAFVFVACVALANPFPNEEASVREPPRRVVSMNVCTDQLAMMLADGKQLLSVSHLAHDPRVSAMVHEAENYRINHGFAEEIYLMEPDLVIAGRYSTQATVNMLERLGIPVVVLEPASRLADVPKRIRQLGEVLGRELRATDVITAYKRDLAALRAKPQQRPRAALYYANGYTSGDKSLAGEIVDAAGFINIAAEKGYGAGSMKLMPLEVLALSNPGIVITGQRYPGSSRAEEILDHPVVNMLRRGRGAGSVTDRDWICGTPHVLQAVRELNQIHFRHRGAYP